MTKQLTVAEPIPFLTRDLLYIIVTMGMFACGLLLGEQVSFNRANKIVTIVDNPNCTVGRMK